MGPAASFVGGIQESTYDADDVVFLGNGEIMEVRNDKTSYPRIEGHVERIRHRQANLSEERVCVACNHSLFLCVHHQPAAPCTIINRATTRAVCCYSACVNDDSLRFCVVCSVVQNAPASKKLRSKFLFLFSFCTL